MKRKRTRANRKAGGLVAQRQGTRLLIDEMRVRPPPGPRSKIFPGRPTVRALRSERRDVRSIRAPGSTTNLDGLTAGRWPFEPEERVRLALQEPEDMPLKRWWRRTCLVNRRGRFNSGERLQGDEGRRKFAPRPSPFAPIFQWSECCTFNAARRVRFPLGVRSVVCLPSVGGDAPDS